MIVVFATRLHHDVSGGHRLPLQVTGDKVACSGVLRAEQNICRRRGPCLQKLPPSPFWSESAMARYVSMGDAFILREGWSILDS